MAATREPRTGRRRRYGCSGAAGQSDRNLPHRNTSSRVPRHERGTVDRASKGAGRSRGTGRSFPVLSALPCREGHRTWGVTPGEAPGPRRPPTPTAAPAGCLYPINTRRARKNETRFRILNVRTRFLGVEGAGGDTRGMRARVVSDRRADANCLRQQDVVPAKVTLMSGLAANQASRFRC